MKVGLARSEARMKDEARAGRELGAGLEGGNGYWLAAVTTESWAASAHVSGPIGCQGSSRCRPLGNTPCLYTCEYFDGWVSWETDTGRAPRANHRLPAGQHIRQQAA